MDVLCGIDNHFQLLLYISENHCQLETKTFFEYFLRIVNKTHDYAILENTRFPHHCEREREREKK